MNKIVQIAIDQENEFFALDDQGRIWVRRNWMGKATHWQLWDEGELEKPKADEEEK